MRALESPVTLHDEHDHIHALSLPTQLHPTQAPRAEVCRQRGSACGHRSIDTHAAGAAPT